MNLRLSCGMALIVLAGCGGSKAPPPVAEAPASVTDVTVESAPNRQIDPGTSRVNQPGSASSPDESRDLEKPEPPVTLESEVKQDIAAQEPFEFDFDLLSTAGQTVKLADFKGKVLIVDFWGTWCPPCRQEIPHFVELLKNHRGAGLEIVGINYERGDPAEFNELINTFAKENSVTYPCLLGDKATQNRVPNLEGFPTTLFIDRSGKVRLQIVGYHPYDHLEIIVQTLLSEADGSTDG